MKRWIIGAAAVLALAGCSGNASASSSKPTSSPSTTSSAYADAGALAAAIGCKGFSDDGSEQLFTKDAGSCILDGADIYVQVFVDNTDRDKWLQAAKQAAGGRYGVGNQWTIQTDSPQVLAMVVGLADGKFWPS